MSFNTFPQNPFPPNSEEAKGKQYELPIASANVLGGVKVGNNLTIDANGALSAPAPSPAYTLPNASAETLGGVKVGSGLSIDDNGVLSANNQLVNYSTTEQATGQKWIDGKDIYQKTVELDTTTQINPTAWTTITSGAGMDKLLFVMTVAGDGTVSDGRLRWKLESGNVQAASIEILNLVSPSITLFYTKTESEE